MEAEAGCKSILTSNIAFSLVREAKDAGPKETTLDLELYILAKDGSYLTSKTFTNNAFSNGTTSPPLMVEWTKVFEPQLAFIPQDKMTVRCRMSNIQGPESGECIARTRIEMQSKIFDVILEKFSALVPGQRRSLKLPMKYGQTKPFSVCILLSKEDRITIEVDQPCDRPCFYRWLLLNSAGNREKCGEDKIVEWGDPFKQTLHLTKKELTRKKQLYLPNDVLTLEFEIILATGKTSEEIHNTENELDSPQNISVMNPDLENLSAPLLEEKQCELWSTLKNDLLSLYNDRMFCDTKLCTEADTFPVHKSVLSARSPVFKAMFTTHLKERSSVCVDIQDLSSDTVRRMLLFLYTDTVGDLEWENAKDLYIAADKYGITSLTQRCVSFLKKNFCVSNVCDILILADMYQNSDLKKVVQDYILEHDAEVFRSDEWKRFIQKHGQLAAETM